MLAFGHKVFAALPLPRRVEVKLGEWQWAFIAFRISDGACSILLPGAALLRYDLGVGGVAGTVAVLNLAAVPAVVLWCRVMDKNAKRRFWTVVGFAVAALALLTLAMDIPYWLYLLAAATYAAFGVATAPGASVLVLQDRPRADWAAATGLLSRRTGFSYLAGLAVTLTLGLAGQLNTQMIFGVAAFLALLAAGIAARTMPKLLGTLPAPLAGTEIIMAGQRRMERLFWFPARLRNMPRFSALRSPLLLGVMAIFAGTVTLMSGFSGILRNELGFTAGLIVLAQSGAHLANASAYRWSGRLGSLLGEPKVIQWGVWLRSFALLGLIAAVAWGGPLVIVIILLFDILLGVSFSLIQVNTPCHIAANHTGGAAAGVGAYHAAVSAGVLGGSLIGWALSASVGLTAVYMASFVLVILGAAVVVKQVGKRAVPDDAVGAV